MRFYVPEWDDRVDANYDFIHDEHSALRTDDRDLAYIWDLFDRASIPIDGVLLSREQAQNPSTKSDRLTENGIYGAQTLNLPEWLPTISDCGAWGYKSLPFPPYDNAEMLEFYDDLGVTTGVTIDHLVLGAGHTARLYLDERAFRGGFGESDLPESLVEDVDVMIDEWPATSGSNSRSWPAYVREEEPSIYQVGRVDPFTEGDFKGTPAEILDRFADDPRAVYREDDMQYRYERTLKNAGIMLQEYETGDYSFRLMAAIQGWDPRSYMQATEEVLDAGYQYIGIGGVAGSSERVVEDVVSGVGNRVKKYERKHDTRVETHVFGFAKTGAFDTIGRAGIASFDSASMLRSAWTGGNNYHLSSEEQFDAIRVRYPNHRDDIQTGIRKALRAQEMLYALRAFDDGVSISDALWTWHGRAERALEELLPYLETNRHDSVFDWPRVRETAEAFRDRYDHARCFRASFGDPVSSQLVKLLRDDAPEDPVPIMQYLEVISDVKSVFDDWTPTLVNEIEERELTSDRVGTFEQLWPLVQRYATWEEIDNGDLLEAYRDLLRRRPWDECTCPICAEHGIEVAIFRGNNRNRRRGFHNTRQFYDEFERELPKVLVLTSGPPERRTGSVERFLRLDRAELWEAVHDLPVAEIGVLTDQGILEWWESEALQLGGESLSGSLNRNGIQKALAIVGDRYQDVFVDSRSLMEETGAVDALADRDCSVHLHEDPQILRSEVLDHLGYGHEFPPDFHRQSCLGGY